MVRIAALIIFFLASAGIRAESFDTLQLLNQADFQKLSKNVAAAAQYRAITPPEPLGTLGFEIGASLSYTDIDAAVLDQASNGDFSVSGFILPRVSVHKGLPFGLDVGATLAMVPVVDITIIGAEARYALVEGGVATPAVGVRASYSQLQGSDDIDMNSMGADISISKGILMFTPYAGVGIVRSNSTAIGIDTLNKETFNQKRLFAGVNINFGVNMVLEADQTGDYTTFSAKAGFRF